jgi:hypothetical protein
VNRVVAATILSNERIIRIDAQSNDGLWAACGDLPSITGFELTTEGACRAELCIPMPNGIVRGQAVNLIGFAHALGQTVVGDDEAEVWSFGEIPATGPVSRTAPDVAASDRRGRPVSLSRFRGKKVLVVTWASW